MKVLFWNTHKNTEINNTVFETIIENGITIAVLAEYSDDIDELCSLLFNSGINTRQYITTGCDRITIIGTEPNVEVGRQSHYASFQIINKTDILCCVHLPSKIFSSSSGMRGIVIDSIVADICSTEIEFGTDNTIVVGDFNINPFDAECIDATKLHGIPYYQETRKKVRTIAGQAFKMFYNPMWRFLGDADKPFGTYYYSGNNTNNTFWQIYDQVIIRPSLRSRFVDSSLKILSETNTRFLLDQNGYPDKRISDHLPLIFEIEEEKNNGNQN